VEVVSAEASLSLVLTRARAEHPNPKSAEPCPAGLDAGCLLTIVQTMETPTAYRPR